VWSVATVADRVAVIVASTIESLGLELYDLEHTGAGLRVLVDREGGIDLEAVTAATRALSRALDEADPFEGAYTLEVSSPGLERPLRTPEHFIAARAKGETVRVKTKAGVEGERRFEGTIVDFEGDGFDLQLADGTTRELLYDDIERARTVFAWGPAPRPGKSKTRAQEAHR
jgi:ribosome maturation factor RimP